MAKFVINNNVAEQIINFNYPACQLVSNGNYDLQKLTNIKLFVRKNKAIFLNCKKRPF
jgi:hypothetical protein